MSEPGWKIRRRVLELYLRKKRMELELVKRAVYVLGLDLIREIKRVEEEMRELKEG